MTKIAFQDLAKWNVDVEEVSASAYRLHAIRVTGNVFEITGTNFEDLVERLREHVRQLEITGKGKARI